MNWKLVKIQYKGVDEPTLEEKTFKEQHVVNAVNFTDAEVRSTQILKEELGNEFNIDEIDEFKIDEIFIESVGKYWYTCGVTYTEISPKGKEKDSNTNVLVRGDKIENVLAFLNERLKEITTPWECRKVVKTKIVEVHK